MPNPFAHIELSTDDVEGAQKFYKAIFGWKINEMPGMNYWSIDVQEGTGGGLQKKQVPEAPTAWLPYVAVDSVKKTLEQAANAGGKIALDYTPIGDMGAIGVLVDPSGAHLGIWEAGPQAKAATKAKAPSKKAAKAAPKAAKKAAPKATKKAPAKAPGKKGPAKKAPGKKGPAKKAPAKKARKRA